jgi:hypothetical protein
VHLVALDTETALSRPGLQAPPLACVSLAGAGVEPLLVSRRDAADVVDDLLRDPGIRIVGHHIAYDLIVLLAHEPGLWPAIREAYEADRVTDTMHREELIDIADGTFEWNQKARGYGLDDVAKARLGVHVDKSEDTYRTRYGELIDVPIELWPLAARRYALNDAEVTFDVARSQEQRADVLADQYRQARAALWIQAMRVYGVVTDPDFVAGYRAACLNDREELSAKLRSTMVATPKGVEPLLRPDRRRRDGVIEEGSCCQAAIRALVSKAYKGDAPKTATGQVSYSAEVLESANDPILQAYADRASLTKIVTEELPILELGTREPIHARYRVLVSSGRTGCKDPNMQNRPRRLGAREAFVPRPGYVYAAADFGGLELATQAQACLSLLGQSELARHLNEGIDPHAVVACRILSIPYAEGMARKKAKEPIFDNARQTGKVANFGFPGGLGAERLVFFAKSTYDVVLTVDEARALKSLWLGEYPEWRDYFRLVDHVIKREGRIIQLFTNRIRGGVGFTDACNTLFQGLGADVAKAAGWRLFCEQWDPTSALFGSHVVIFPHDEFYSEVREDGTEHEAAMRLGAVMAEAARPLLPDVRLEAEPFLTRRMSKLAGPKHDANGRLRPWDVTDIKDKKAA